MKHEYESGTEQAVHEAENIYSQTRTLLMLIYISKKPSRCRCGQYRLCESSSKNWFPNCIYTWIRGFDALKMQKNNSQIRTKISCYYLITESCCHRRDQGSPGEGWNQPITLLFRWTASGTYFCRPPVIFVRRTSPRVGASSDPRCARCYGTGCRIPGPRREGR
jgi:hypothetical protein